MTTPHATMPPGAPSAPGGPVTSGLPRAGLPPSGAATERPRVLVIGGTGLLGGAAALALGESADVTIASRHRPTAGPFAAFAHRRSDLDHLDPDASRALVGGMDAVVLAAGPDDRAPYPRPAAGYLADHLVAPTRVLADACAAVGVRALVVIGSFFTAWERTHPGFADPHPYVRARLDQIAVLREHPTLAAVVVEVPYVVGVGQGRYPGWLDVVVDNAVTALPVVAYPSGGATACTVEQVGAAVAGAVRRALRRGPGTECLPVGERVLPWSELFAELGAGMGRMLRLVPVPAAVAALPARRLAWSARRSGGYLGVDPARIVTDALGITMALDPAPSRAALGYPHADIGAAVRASGAAYAAAHRR